MKNVKDFVLKYKVEILIALAAISSIIASIMTMDGVNAGICSVAIAFIAVLIEVLKNGVSEASITLLANAIKILLEALKKEDVVKVSITKSSGEVKELTIDEIKEQLIDGLK